MKFVGGIRSGLRSPISNMCLSEIYTLNVQVDQMVGQFQRHRMKVKANEYYYQKVIRQQQQLEKSFGRFLKVNHMKLQHLRSHSHVSFSLHTTICIFKLVCSRGIDIQSWISLYDHTAVETWVNPSEGPNLANPKSDSFAFHCSSRRILEDLKSLKMIYNINIRQCQ